MTELEGSEGRWESKSLSSANRGEDYENELWLPGESELLLFGKSPKTVLSQLLASPT